jgi:hypothetical protein
VTLFEAVVLERLAPASRLSVRVHFFLQSGFTFCGPDLGRKTALVLGPFLGNQF